MPELNEKNTEVNRVSQRTPLSNQTKLGGMLETQ